MKKDAAILLAQSLLCKGNTFACEECDLCKGVKAHEYADMIYLDGSEISIKKEDIKSCRNHLKKQHWKRTEERYTYWIMLKMQQRMH